jgi:oligopeptide transport system ATP-binding protein
MYSESVAHTDSKDMEVVRVENLHVHFTTYDGRLRRRRTGTLRAVDGVSFILRRGETLGLVGASGCGKTAVARAVGMLERPTSGRIFFQGQELTARRGSSLKRARHRIQMLFSNPYSAFAPRMGVEDILSEALALSEGRSMGDRDQRLADLLAQVGLNLYLALRFPRDLSGGIRQRLAVARALAAEPALLICDQPTDFVDPAEGDAIIDLLQRLRQQLGLTMLLTARQVTTVRHADRVAVMILGRIVEMGYYSDLVRQPLHPFTRALLRLTSGGFVEAASPTLGTLHPAPGCFYAPVCPLVEARCRTSYPVFVEGAPGHGVACHLVEPE